MPPSITHRSLLEPQSLTDALAMLGSERQLTPMAGCTDLYVSLNFGTLKATRFLNLWGLDALRYIERRGRSLSIGPLTTYTDLIRSPLVRRSAPILAQAAGEVGGVQIQNRGTLGGNIANASPAGDTLPVLAALDATLILASAGAIRSVPFTSFFTGYRQTVLGADELIVSIEIPCLRGRQWFRKVGTRAAQAISKVVMAAVAGDDVRVAVGSVAPTVVRLPETEAALMRGARMDEVERALLAEIAPIDDLRSTADYRRRVTANLLRRAAVELQLRER